MKMNKFLMFLFLRVGLCLAKSAFSLDYQCELEIESETNATLDSIANKATAQNIAGKPIGNIMSWVALQLLGKPYVPKLLDMKLPEYLYVSLDETDCMLFVEEVLAVSELIKNNRLDMENLTDETKVIRYHGDVTYCNRNHYFKDWALVNQNKGFVKDEAFLLTHQALPYKAQVMSARIAANKADPHYSNLSCIKKREKLINNEKLGFIPIDILPKYLSAIKDGDIIGIVRFSPDSKADSIHHLGIAYITNGQVGMIEASSIHKKVIIDPSLMNYLNKFKDSKGIILLRAI